MASLPEIMQVCRLCLVNDQVNVPIFDGTSDIRETFAKISSCLPVKVSQDDNLPKKICDGCSYKLDLLHDFRNTSVNSEKQLLQWLQQIGVSSGIPTAATSVPTTSQTNSDILVKQESFEHNEGAAASTGGMSAEAQSYIIQQQKLPYRPEFPGFEESSASTSEPPPKRARRAAAMKAPIAPDIDSDEDDLDNDMTITKAESDDDSDEADQPSYVDATSTSVDDQPGPSGVGKSSVEASGNILDEDSVSYVCTVCLETFPNQDDFTNHHFDPYDHTFNCCKCGNKFKDSDVLYTHLDNHKLEDEGEIVNINPVEEEGEELVLNYENAGGVLTVQKTVTEAGNEQLVYILDDSQCVNEVIIEEHNAPVKRLKKPKVSDNVRIVQLEHEYIIPEVEQHVLNGRQRTIPVTIRGSLGRQHDIHPKPRITQPKRRHAVPDFSSTNFIFINANEEIDIPHYKCLRCEQLFINKFVFFRHIEKGKCYINSCDGCSATFTKNSDFYDHYVQVHTDRAICRFCFRTFMYEKNVKEHMLRHLDQFRHRCDECNKGFYTVREYRNHYKNRHMGIRHTCDYCTRSFADEYYFRRHLATHEQGVAAVE